LVDGLLINAGALVNDISIIKTEPTETFAYYHVELANHTLLLAEGASAESFFPNQEDRSLYDNGAEYEELYPNGSKLMLWPMDYPRVSSHNKVPRYVRQKLMQIAEELYPQKAA
ncbi:MAG: Hint domain-containing protein, partial [Cyanobacteria bacterium J06623_7]